MRNLSAILYILLLAACASSVPADPVAPPSSADIYIRVDGMTRVQGITWLGWPNAVEDALAGLDGIQELETDLASDTFHITYDPARTDVPAMLGAIESAGYRGELVERAAASQPHPAWNISDLPPELRQLFAQAGVEDKLVLIDVHGPGWLPCVKMERVTYPDTEVQQLLERSYLRKVLDLELDAEAVSAFGVLGIPVAIIADADGLELDRIEGFVEPQDYARRLDGLAKR